jgi:hypothetical protein
MPSVHTYRIVGIDHWPYSSLTDNVTPSLFFMVQDKKLVCYVYELVDGEVESV